MIFIILCVVAVLVAVLVKRCPRTVPYEQCSEVYKRYSRVEGVRATYIKDFRVNDTLTIGVTLLEATDSAGWKYLLQKFNISQEMQTVFEQVDFGVMSWNSPKDNPEVRATTIGECRDVSLTDKDIEICACSFRERKICVFHTQSEEEILAIDNYNYDNMINQTNLLNHEKDN
ncbi:MAG: hypothetical protein IKH33_09710 [Bacteroidales bacterium]|nr:hypothetical protein [Bacteroidales bacterium]